MFRVSFSLLNPLPSLQLTKLQGLSISCEPFSTDRALYPTQGFASENNAPRFLTWSTGFAKLFCTGEDIVGCKRDILKLLS